MSNTQMSSHTKDLGKLVLSSKQSYIAVAFLKESGLNILLADIKKALKKKQRFTVIVGRHFALSEPKAIWTLFHLFNETTSTLYLADLVNNEVFHPKMYLFYSANSATVIVGSANLTSGGLVNNYECSVAYTCVQGDPMWIQSLRYFNDELLANAKVATRKSILLYESFFNQQKKARKETRAVPLLKDSVLEFDYAKLRKHLKKFSVSHRALVNKEKASDYRKAKKVLDKMADTKTLTLNRFKELFEELTGGDPGHYRYWNSGGLSRGKNGKDGKPGIYAAWRSFAKLVKFVSDNRNESPAYVFAQGKKLLAKINYAGINHLTEIMMTYNPSAFANMNNNPLKVLKHEAGLNIKSSPSSYTGTDYEEYCLLLTEICKELGLRNMLEADSFFNDIYWELKKKKLID